MNFKKNIKKLIQFKKEMLKYSHIEKTSIKPIVNWKNKLQKKVKTTSKIINLNECKSWYFDKNMNIDRNIYVHTFLRHRKISYCLKYLRSSSSISTKLRKYLH